MLWLGLLVCIAIATMAFSIAMIATWLDILNCSGKQHDPFEKGCLQGASSCVHVLTFHCGKTCIAGLAYTCAECVQLFGSCSNPIEDGATANSGVGRQERYLLVPGRCFDFWTTLHHQQFQNRNQHEKKNGNTEFCCSPCPTLSRLDRCRRNDLS